MHMYVDELGVSETFPASHAMHGCGPAWNLYFPAAQPTHPSSLRDQPALHAQSVASLLLSAENEYGGHGTHCERSTDAYDPARQFVQVLATAPTLPENLPGAHAVQAPEPGWLLNFPGTHAGHPVSCEVCPAWHTQSAVESLPSSESELLWHCTHCVRSSVEYEPVAH